MGTRHGFTNEQLELLTEDERQAILDEDTLEPEDVAAEDEDGAADEAAAKDKGADPAVPEEGAEAKTAVEEDGKKAADADPDEDEQAAADAAKADDAAAQQEPPAKQEAAPPPKPSPSPTPHYDVPADAKEQLTQFDSQLDEIAQKFDDGELTAVEMRQQQREIERQRDDLKERMLKASVAVDNAKAKWFQADVPVWLGQHTEYQPGTLRMRLLNDVVKELQAESDNPFDPGILDRAHARIQQEMGQVAPKQHDPAPKPQRQIPPSLAHVPASDISETEDNGRFAHLDRLAEKDPIAYEAEIAKMSDAEREAYLQAG